MSGRIVQYYSDVEKTNKEYPITLTKAIYDEDGNNLSNTLANDFVQKTNIVDNLESTSTVLPLSANQGKVLNNRIDTLDSNLESLGGFTPVIDSSTGEITGYKTTIGGADTVFPFKKSSSSAVCYKEYRESSTSSTIKSVSRTLDFSDVENYKNLTINNFVIRACTKIYITDNMAGQTISYSGKYNNTTGKLTITLSGGSGFRMYAGNVFGAAVINN